ncbi:hypothetical protein EP30_09725 [Bifidobacterium sp. UTCIF-39]|nr:hypothetical protein EP30_09725 [Bifidobacterium sp. UTCIF-39]
MCRLIVVFLTVVAMLATGVNIVPEAFGETTDDAASSETVQSPDPLESADAGIPSTSNSSNSNDVSQGGQEVTGNSKSEIRVNLFKDANHQQPLENTDKVQVGDTIRPYRLGLGRERETDDRRQHPLLHVPEEHHRQGRGIGEEPQEPVRRTR